MSLTCSYKWKFSHNNIIKITFCAWQKGFAHMSCLSLVYCLDFSVNSLSWHMQAVERRVSRSQSFTCKTLIAPFSVLLQNGHPGGQIWLWDPATPEPGHVSVRQPQTAGGRAKARPRLPDQQPVGHLLDHHILSVTCTGFPCWSATECEAGVTQYRWFLLFSVATKTCISPLHCRDITQIRGMRHLDDTSGAPAADGVHWADRCRKHMLNYYCGWWFRVRIAESVSATVCCRFVHLLFYFIFLHYPHRSYCVGTLWSIQCNLWQQTKEHAPPQGKLLFISIPLFTVICRPVMCSHTTSAVAVRL